MAQMESPARAAAQAPGGIPNTSSDATASASSSPVLSAARGALLMRISAAEQQLRAEASVSDAIALAQLIGACAAALQKLEPPTKLRCY